MSLLKILLVGGAMAAAVILNANAAEMRFGNGDFVGIEQESAGAVRADRGRFTRDADVNVPARLGHQ